jgi:hypothetical protein
MKKIIFSVALALITLPDVYAQEPFTTHKVIEFYNKALIEKNETALSRLKYFIEATGDGVTTTNAYFGARGTGMLFCRPKASLLRADRIIKLIEEFNIDFKAGNTIYPNDPLEATLPITIIWTLTHFYPCN